MTIWRGLCACYALVWAAATATATAGIALNLHVVRIGTPHDALSADVATALELAVHNAPLALWPLALVAVGWPTIPIIRRAGDVLVTGQLIVNGASVGDALAQQPQLWRYLPHLPIEWLALAAPAAGWWLARCEDGNPQRHLRLAVGTGVAVVSAAVLETWTVPL